MEYAAHPEAGASMGMGARDGGAAVAAASHRAPIRLSAATIRLEPNARVGTLRGRVVAFDSGLPVTNATLSFERDGRIASVATDGEGEFVFAPDEIGTYVLAIAMAEGFLPFGPEWGQSPIRFQARHGAHVEGIVIILVPAVEIVARVVREGDMPVEGAVMRIHGAEHGQHALAPLESTYVTGPGGEARVIAPDEAVIEASHPQHGHGRAMIDSGVQATRRVVVRLEREPPARMRAERRIVGHVIDTEGTPIGGARVVASFETLPAAADAHLHPPLHAETDQEGGFVLSGADEGSYRLVATADEHGRASMSGVRAGAEDVIIRMAAEGRLRVRVIDAARGAPVAAASVVVEQVTGPLTAETVAVMSSYDAEGTIEVLGLAPGPHRVIASAPGYGQSEAVNADVRLGADEVVTISVHQGGRVVGRVISESDGRGLGGARATLEGQLGSGASAVPLETSALTDSSGRFELIGVPEGVHSIVVWARDHHGRIRSGLAVRTGEVLDAGSIDLRAVAEGATPVLEFAGIGAVLAAEGDAIVIGQVVPGGGAAEAGLVSGDAIVEVEGVPVIDLGFERTIERIRGPEGSVVALRVRRTPERIETVVVSRRRIRA